VVRVSEAVVSRRIRSGMYSTDAPLHNKNQLSRDVGTPRAVVPVVFARAAKKTIFLYLNVVYRLNLLAITDVVSGQAAGT
jgi:hypothetical protein